MSTEPGSERIENDVQATKRAILVWWHGGESQRQKIRRATGVYQQGDAFEKPANPKYHFTAAAIRKPLAFVKGHSTAIVIGVVIAIISLVIEYRWFNQ